MERLEVEGIVTIVLLIQYPSKFDALHVMRFFSPGALDIHRHRDDPTIIHQPATTSSANNSHATFPQPSPKRSYHLTTAIKPCQQEIYLTNSASLLTIPSTRLPHKPKTQQPQNVHLHSPNHNNPYPHNDTTEPPKDPHDNSTHPPYCIQRVSEHLKLSPQTKLR